MNPVDMQDEALSNNLASQTNIAAVELVPVLKTVNEKFPDGCIPLMRLGACGRAIAKARRIKFRQYFEGQSFSGIRIEISPGIEVILLVERMTKKLREELEQEGPRARPSKAIDYIMLTHIPSDPGEIPAIVEKVKAYFHIEPPEIFSDFAADHSISLPKKRKSIAERPRSRVASFLSSRD